jgi:1-acyl-sn-glycerol-3-phosphate acyltransferase
MPETAADDAAPPRDERRRGGGGPTVWAVTLCANLYLVVATIVLATVALAVSWLPPRGRWFYLLARVWSRGILLSSFVRLERRFESPLTSGQTYIFMSNHQSLLDIPALIVALPGETRFLAKRALFQIPLFGWALKLGGFISIDRSDRSRASESFGEAIGELARGASAVVFPEGTRSDDGRLLPFQRGGFLLALKSGLPIIPVGIRGSGAARPARGYRVVPGPITVSCGRPVDPADYGVRNKQRLTEEVRRRIAALAGADPG